MPRSKDAISGTAACVLFSGEEVVEQATGGDQERSLHHRKALSFLFVRGRIPSRAGLLPPERCWLVCKPKTVSSFLYNLHIVYQKFRVYSSAIWEVA
jgi:hypothetical protein